MAGGLIRGLLPSADFYIVAPIVVHIVVQDMEGLPVTTTSGRGRNLSSVLLDPRERACLPPSRMSGFPPPPTLAILSVCPALPSGRPSHMADGLEKRALPLVSEA